MGIGGDTCYRLRGGLIHRADMRGNHGFKYSHVIFTVRKSYAPLHAFVAGSDENLAMMIDLDRFCEAMGKAARRWYDDNKDNATVHDNLSNLIRLSPSGLYPFVEGMPVLASGEDKLDVR